MPEGYAGHPSLANLDLMGNQLTALHQAWLDEPSPDESAPLSYFRASYNNLTSGFPIGLAMYPNLNTLRLNNNSLRYGKRSAKCSAA